MKNFNRVFVIIMDGVGCGVQDDYDKYHKVEANTLLSVYKTADIFSLPILEKIGLRHILFDESLALNTIAGKMRELTAGNDTMAGVWEMFGIIRSKRYLSSKISLSDKLITEIERELGTQIVGNEYISGFKALDKFYVEHVEKKSPILYISDDGIILFAAHEKVIQPDQLNFLGLRLSKILKGKNVSRVITRPFSGNIGNFERTANRQDFLCDDGVLSSPILQSVKKRNFTFKTTEHLYKILGQPYGVEFIKGNHNNHDLLKIIYTQINNINETANLQLFCLQDFDMAGHKKDPISFAEHLKYFDTELPSLIEALKEDDLLIITADHGCDPKFPDRGHTREFVPLLITFKNLVHGKSLGVRNSFADIGQTICDIFKLPPLIHGQSFYETF